MNIFDKMAVRVISSMGFSTAAVGAITFTGPVTAPRISCAFSMASCYGLMLAALLTVHHEINHIHALAMRAAVAAKAVRRMGFVVKLHAGRFVLMKRAAYPVVLVGFVTVISNHICKREPGFNLRNFHC